jgi:hypothetical protein
MIIRKEIFTFLQVFGLLLESISVSFFGDGDNGAVTGHEVGFYGRVFVDRVGDYCESILLPTHGSWL